MQRKLHGYNQKKQKIKKAISLTPNNTDFYILIRHLDNYLNEYSYVEYQ